MTGLDFETLARVKVFDPLGMQSASTTYDGLTKSDNFAHPYSWSSGSKKLYRSSITLPYFKVATAGGVSSSIRDLARYMQAQMGLYPDVFSPNALQLAHEALVQQSDPVVGQREVALPLLQDHRVPLGVDEHLPLEHCCVAST